MMMTNIFSLISKIIERIGYCQISTNWLPSNRLLIPQKSAYRLL